MAEKSVIIIGAGIAGLAAGCYGRMNGYRTQIFEMHDKPGGVCTAWTRKGYTIDGCIHWLVGTNPSNSFYPIWRELGALLGQPIVNHDYFVCIEGDGGKTFKVYADMNRLEQHMKDLAPEDKDVIEEFIRGARKCARMNMPVDKAPELYNPIDGFKLMFQMLPFLGFMRKWSKVSAADFAQRFKNPFMREAFINAFVGEIKDFPLFFMLMTIAWLDQKAAGYTVGGSLEFARAIERRCLDLGGEINYKSPVAKILVKDGKAVGVRLADGSEHRGDVIISAADGHATIFDMLGGKYVDAKIKGYYDKPSLFPPLIYVGLGVGRTFDDIPSAVAGLAFPVEPPIVIAGKKHRNLGVQIYNFDPTLAPKGKTAMKVQFMTDYNYWKKLSRQPERYKAEKEQIADQVVAALDRRFPGLARKVEMRNVATPLTWERLTGNWRGSYEGWLPTTKTGMAFSSGRMSKTLPGLDNFYMIGQWVEPGGGVPTAAMSARNVMQILCKRDKKPFVTTVP